MTKKPESFPMHTKFTFRVLYKTADIAEYICSEFIMFDFCPWLYSTHTLLKHTNTHTHTYMHTHTNTHTHTHTQYSQIHTNHDSKIHKQTKFNYKVALKFCATNI